MTKMEKSLWSWLTDHLELVLMVFATLLAVLIRICLINHVTGDMDVYLLSWYKQIKAGGGFRALTSTVGNYNIPYQVIIALLTYLPIEPMYGYKLVSILFDFVLAGAAGWIVWILFENKLKAAITYAIIICFPMVFLNSAMWGQCDAIYAAFCLCSIACYLKKRYIICFLFLGIGLAFKLQAIFMIPLFFFLYVAEKKYPIWKILCIPVPILILSLPAIVQGRPVSDVFAIYFRQTQSYKYVSMNYPSFWTIAFGNKNADYYSLFKNIAVSVTLLALVLLMIFFFKRWKEDPKLIISAGFVFSYTCVLFLPSMHERYDYLPMVLGLLLMFLDYRTIPLYLGLCIINIKDYFVYLSEATVNWNVLAIANVFIYAGYLCLIFHHIYCVKDNEKDKRQL